MGNTIIRIFLFLITFSLLSGVELGLERFIREGKAEEYKTKSVGLITNQTGLDSCGVPTLERLSKAGLSIRVLFSPEHGYNGKTSLPIYDLHTKHRAPTQQMLKGVDLLIYDIQDIGVRSYTYASTLFLSMEAAAKQRIPMIVLDRPNPIGGETIDGPLLEKNCRSFLGLMEVPYCHGMTIGELAKMYNAEYKIGCDLRVIPMKGWSRSMHFADTGLAWTPTSPQVPEADTPLYYATTGLLGELSLLSIGIGYTLPFKVVGAPWIDADLFATRLNEQKLPGVRFAPFHFMPFFGRFKKEECYGVIIHITDAKIYRPISTQYLLLGMLKSLYPSEVLATISALPQIKKDLFIKASGTYSVLTMLEREKLIAWKLIEMCRSEKQFSSRRAPYLLYK